MKNQKQKTTTDCIRTCLACILGIDCEEIPDFTLAGKEEDQWWVAEQTWLAERGYSMLQISYTGEHSPITPPFADIPCIAFGLTKKGHNHACVARVTQVGIEIAHNPLDGADIVGLLGIGVLIPRDYAKAPNC